MRFLSLLVLLFLVTACDVVNTEVEHGYMPIKAGEYASKFKLGYSVDRGDRCARNAALGLIPQVCGTLSEFVPQGETVENWSEILTIKFMEKYPGSITNASNDKKADLINSCGQQVGYTILESSPSRIISEWVLKSCPNKPDQYYLSAYYKGNDGIHLVSYGKKGFEIKPEQKAYWVDKLKSVQILKGKNVVN